jgi:hypothetical protein
MPTPAAICLDMDGVLCDFFGGVNRLFGVPSWPYPYPVGDWDWYAHFPYPKKPVDLAPHMNFEFHRDLDWTPDGEEILAAAAHLVGADNVWLVTAPWHTPGCRDGKAAWVERHCPVLLPRLVVTSSKVVASHPGWLLLDDSDKNCAAYEAKANGGRAAVVPRPWNARHADCCLSTGRVLDLAPLFG